MAFAQVISEVTLSETTDTTSHDIPGAGSVANDILLVVMAIDGNPTITIPAGWTSLVDAQDSAGTNFKLVAFFKRTAGAESSTTLSTSVAEKSVGRHMLIRGADPTTNPAVATPITANSINPDAPSLDPAGWGAEDTLWIPIVACHNGATTFSAFPASHTNGVGISSGGTTDGCVLGIARRELNATSQDPSAFTIDQARSYVASQVAIRPSAAVTSPLTVPVSVDADDEYWSAQSVTYPVVATPVKVSSDIIQAGRSLEDNYKVRVALLRFDTSALPDDAYITGAGLLLDYTQSDHVNDLSLVADAPTWTGVASDWTNGVPSASSMRIISPLHRYSPGGGGINVSVDDVSFINKSGYSYLRLMITQRPGDAAPTGQNFVNIATREHATLNEPRLSISFTTTTPTLAGNSREFFYHVQPPLLSPKASRPLSYNVGALAQAFRAVRYDALGLAATQRALSYDILRGSDSGGHCQNP